MLFSKKNIIAILYYSGAMGITSLVPFVMLPILTKELSLADYGVLALIEASILFVTPLVSLRVEAGIGVEYFKLKRRLFKLYVVNSLFISILAFFVTLGVLFILKDSISKLISLDQFYILLLPVFSLLRVVGAVLLTIFRSEQRPEKFFILCLFQGGIDLGLSFFMVVIFKFGIYGRLTGVYFALLVVTISGILYLYKKGYFRVCSSKYFKKILQYSSPLIPHAIAGFMIVMSDRYFIANYFGVGEVGLYAAGYQISGVMLLIGSVINQFWSPQLYNYLRNNSYSDAKKMAISISLILIFLSCVIFLTRDYFYMILVDQKYHESKPYFNWLLLGFLFQSLYFVVTNYLFFYEETALLSKLTIFGASLNLVLNYVLIIWFSSIGVAYSTAISWLALFLMVFLTVSIKKKKWEEGRDVEC